MIAHLALGALCLLAVALGAVAGVRSPMRSFTVRRRDEQEGSRS